MSEQDARTECARLEGINSELLEALRAMLVEYGFDTGELEGGSRRDPEHKRQAAMLARAAIAKAANA